jgi:hypothetical protein
LPSSFVYNTYFITPTPFKEKDVFLTHGQRYLARPACNGALGKH